MRHRLLYLILAAGLVAAACGGDDGGGGGGGGEGEGLGVERVDLAIDTDDYMNNLAWIVADARYWPDLGFQEPANIVATDEYMAGLLGGDVWVAQGESDVIWAALAEGSVPMKIVGVEKDTEAWFIGIREGVDEGTMERGGEVLRLLKSASAEGGVTELSRSCHATSGGGPSGTLDHKGLSGWEVAAE